MTTNKHLAATQVNLLGAWIDPLTREAALDLILGWCRSRARQYVVTPNLDHCRLLRVNKAFASACENAALSLPDGWPLIAASRVTKFPIKRRVTGSDLIVPLCKGLAANSYSIFLLGSSDSVLTTASAKLQELAPGLIISGTYSPPFGFERDDRQLEAINRRLSELKPHVVVVALGAPKQELWMAAQVQHLPIGVALGLGGTLDFLAGKQRRAPQFVQSLGLEWLWRMLSNPRRLGRRYALDLALLPVLAAGHAKRHLLTGRNTVRRRLLPM